MTDWGIFNNKLLFENDRLLFENNKLLFSVKFCGGEEKALMEGDTVVIGGSPTRESPDLMCCTTWLEWLRH